jgi:hypothetical protein
LLRDTAFCDEFAEVEVSFCFAFQCKPTRLKSGKTLPANGGKQKLKVTFSFYEQKLQEHTFKETFAFFKPL